jgi:hypothetical protein
MGPSLLTACRVLCDCALFPALQLWVDKYRPAALDKMTYHTALSERLGKLVCFSNHDHGRLSVLDLWVPLSPRGARHAPCLSFQLLYVSVTCFAVGPWLCAASGQRELPMRRACGGYVPLVNAGHRR